MKKNIYFTQILLTAGILGLAITANAQNIRFSQNRFSPALLNPASINEDYKANLMFHHRRQQVMGNLNLSTSAITGKYPLFDKDQNHWVSVAVSAFNDQSSMESLFQYQGLGLAFAGKMHLGGRTYLNVGGQGFYQSQSTSSEDIRTGSQYVQNQGYDPSMDSGEDFENLRTNYLDGSAGVYFTSVTPDRETDFFAGLSAFRINRPRAELYKDESLLPVKWALMAGKRIVDAADWSITPDFIFIKDGNNQWFNAGVKASYHFENENAFEPFQQGEVSLTPRYLTSDALAFAFKFEQPNFAAGFTYETPFLAETSGITRQSAFEFSVAIKTTIFKPSQPKKLRNYSIGEVRQFYNQDREAQKRKRRKMDKGPGLNPFGKDAETSAGGRGNREGSSLDTLSVEEKSVQFVLEKKFNFAFNDTTLTEQAKDYLEQFAVLMKENKDLNLEVIGHTDSIGSPEVNKEISLSRAGSVVRHLKKQGIEPDRLKATGKGASEPLVPNDAPENRAKNRRVEFVIFK